MESASQIVQVISREIIRPSTETPPHLKKHKLSLLDQIMPWVYVPLILFYEPCREKGAMISSQRLKRSLSETLASFYPLAGKLDRENMIVECVDAGVNYVEARVLHHYQLLEALKDYQNCETEHDESLRQFLPVTNHSHGLSKDVLLHIQVSFFDCGGVAFGVCMSHGVGDAASLVSFVNTWAATCRGGVKIINPGLDLLAAHLPAAKALSGNVPDNINLSSWFTSTVTRRIVFDKEKLAQLRASAVSSPRDEANRSGNTVKDPTRVELVSALIWNYLICIAKSKELSKPCSFLAYIGVNLRTRAIPPPSLENSFGNGPITQYAIIDEQEDGALILLEYDDFVRKIRNAIRSVDDDYIRNQSKVLSGFSVPSVKGRSVECCAFSSWCRFPVYDADYGWGKPAWIAITDFPVNTTVLVDTKTGDGIEAWITLQRSDADLLGGSLTTAILDNIK